MEIWKQIPGFELYEASTCGNIRRIGTIEPLKTWLSSNKPNRGYKVVSLYKDGKKYDRYVHRLTAITHVPNPYNKPVVHHKDENRFNNNVSNLEWCTYGENNTRNGLNDRRGKSYSRNYKIKRNAELDKQMGRLFP